MITMKRPFCMKLELERNEMVKLIAKLGEENSRVDDKILKDDDGYYTYKRVYFKCPCCDLCHSERRKYNFHNNDVEFNYDTAHLYILEHIKQMVRLHGEISHMQFIIDYFGKERGKFILDYYARKNIFVAEKIKEFLSNLK